MTAWTKNPAAGTAEGLAVNLICADAPAFAGDGDHQTKLRLDHSVGTFHAPLADLLRAVSSGSSWHLQHKALQPLADVRELTTGTIEVGPDGRRRLPIYAQKLTPRGTYAGFRYGWCTAGNDDPLVMHENAEFVVNALTEARKFVAEGRDSAIALRGIGQDWIVLDAEDAPLFDTRSWAVREIERVELSPQFGHRMFGGIDRFEVFDKKSGERLADMLANTDGTFTTTARARWSRRPARIPVKSNCPMMSGTRSRRWPRRPACRWGSSSPPAAWEVPNEPSPRRLPRPAAPPWGR